MDPSLAVPLPLVVAGEEFDGLETGALLADPLLGRDEPVGVAVVSGPVVGKSDEVSAADDESVEDSSSVHVSGTEVTDGVLDSDGPVVAYVRLGTYEPVLLGLPIPVPPVPFITGLVPRLESVPGIIEDNGTLAAVVALLLLASDDDVVNCALEFGLSGPVVLALEALLALEE